MGARWVAGVGRAPSLPTAPCWTSSWDSPSPHQYRHFTRQLRKRPLPAPAPNYMGNYFTFPNS